MLHIRNSTLSRDVINGFFTLDMADVTDLEHSMG